ncbi:MAG: FMN-binding negative transcriptional regulator [Sphingomonadaceae bacterium]
MAYQINDRVLHEALLDEIGFGMVFLTTPDGPRIAHTPLLSTGDGVIRFHLARGNAMARYLAGETALIVVNGPDGYVSPRWYADQAAVPTWDYVSLELEGPVQRMDQDGLEGLLNDLISRHESRISHGKAWHRGYVPEADWRKKEAGIVGFELEILAWRPTFKLSQNKSPADREAIAAGLEANGSPALAQLIRTLAQ